MKKINFNTQAMVWILVLMMTTIFFSCEKDKDPLENCRKDPTCEYFVCKVDGERWEPQCNSDPLFGCTPWDVQYYRNIEWFIMSVSNENLKESFVLYVEGNLQNNTNYEIYTNENSPSHFYNAIIQDICSEYKVLKDINGSFKIVNFNTENRIIKGEFSFIAKYDCGDEVKITDGEFNLPYRF